MKSVDMLTVFLLARLLVKRGWNSDNIAATDVNGKPCGPFSDEATSFSLHGAIIRANREVSGERSVDTGFYVFRKFREVMELDSNTSVITYQNGKSKSNIIQALDECTSYIMVGIVCEAAEELTGTLSPRDLMIPLLTRMNR